VRALSKAAVTGDIVKAFKIGLYFRLTLLRQDVPGLDDLLDGSFPFASMNSASSRPLYVEALQHGSGEPSKKITSTRQSRCNPIANLSVLTN
jgi:hypothetical protein